MDDMLEDMSPEEIERLQALAAALPEREDTDPTGELHRLAEAALSIAYEFPGRWRINYRMPDGATIPFGSGMVPQQVMAQIRGMLADFAGRQLAKSKPDGG